MHVVCPSCHTRYRHEFSGTAACTAHCSACDERFRPVAPKRTYVLVPGAGFPDVGPGPGHDSPIGMDDPTLAGQTNEAVHAGARGLADPLMDLEIPADDVALTDPTENPAERTAGKRTGHGSTTLIEALVAVTPCALGAGLAYSFAGSLNRDPTVSAILGGVTGLLPGWACLIWITIGE